MYYIIYYPSNCIYCSVVDHRGVFTNVCTGWPGSVHDSRVLRNSGLYANSDRIINSNYFLIADAGYPLYKWYKISYNNHTNDNNYNNILS